MLNVRTALLFFLLIFFLSNYARAQNTPDTVKVGMYVVSVHDIDFHDNEYTIRFWLWFVYNQPGKGEESKFDFSKQIDIPNAKQIDDPLIVYDTIDGKVWAQLKMKCVMKENWQVHNFPFDQQRLKVIIENTVYDNKSLVFVADTLDSGFDSLEVLNGWHLRNYNVSSGTSLYNTGFGDPDRHEKSVNAYSNFVFEMNIGRDAVGLFMKIFVGMYVSFLIALLSFLAHPSELEPRFGLPVGSLFAAVGNKYIIDSILPESSMFGLVDILHTLTFMGIFFVLATSGIALKLHNRGKEETAHRVTLIGFIFVTVVYLVANIYFVARA